MVLTISACTRPAKVNEPAVPEQGRIVEKPSPELTVIDSMIWRHADSALVMMLEFVESPEADSLDVFDGHYCQLLLSELLFKNYYSQSNREELLQAVVFFDSLPQNDHTVFLDARAHYMNGVGYYEQDSVVPAVAEYYKTLELMEGHFGEKELVGRKAQLMSLSFNRLGEIYQQQMLTEPGIACFKQSMLYCQREPTSIYGISNSLQHIGMLYDMADQKDSASYYYNEAMAHMPNHDNVHYRDLRAIMAHNAYYSGACLDSVMADFYYLISHASDDSERLTRYLTIGGILLDDRKYDSARFYLDTVFEKQEDIESKIVAAEELSLIYQTEGDSIKAHQYASFLAGYTLKEIEKKTNVSKIYEFFKSYTQNKLEKRAREERREASLHERKKAVRITLALMIPLAVVLAVAIFVMRRRHGKERQRHRLRQAAMSGRLKRSNQELRELKEQIRQQNDMAHKTEKQVETFTDEPICRLIMERVNEGQFKSQMDCTVYKDFALMKEQVTALREAADRHFNQFTSRIAKAYPDLTRGDLDYCCLYLLDLNDADIAALMQKAYPTVSQRARKIKGIFGNEEPLSNLLHSFAYQAD